MVRLVDSWNHGFVRRARVQQSSLEVVAVAGDHGPVQHRPRLVVGDVSRVNASRIAATAPSTIRSDAWTHCTSPAGYLMARAISTGSAAVLDELVPRFRQRDRGARVEPFDPDRVHPAQELADEAATSRPPSASHSPMPGPDATKLAVVAGRTSSIVFRLSERCSQPVNSCRIDRSAVEPEVTRGRVARGEDLHVPAARCVPDVHCVAESTTARRRAGRSRSHPCETDRARTAGRSMPRLSGAASSRAGHEHLRADPLDPPSLTFTSVCVSQANHHRPCRRRALSLWWRRATRATTAIRAATAAAKCSKIPRRRGCAPWWSRMDEGPPRRSGRCTRAVSAAGVRSSSVVVSSVAMRAIRERARRSSPR